MTEKIGLKIVDLIHDITQKGNTVSFSEDIHGMIAIRYYKDEELVEYQNLGTPNCERIVLERAIIRSLSNFLEKHTDA